MLRATLGQGWLLFALSLTQLLGGGLHGTVITHDAAAILHVAELAITLGLARKNANFFEHGKRAR